MAIIYQFKLRALEIISTSTFIMIIAEVCFTADITGAASKGLSTMQKNVNSRLHLTFRLDTEM